MSASDIPISAANISISTGLIFLVLEIKKFSSAASCWGVSLRRRATVGEGTALCPLAVWKKTINQYAALICSSFLTSTQITERSSWGWGFTCALRPIHKVSKKVLREENSKIDAFSVPYNPLKS